MLNLNIKERIDTKIGKSLITVSVLFLVLISCFYSIHKYTSLNLSDVTSIATVFAAIATVCALVFLAIEAKFSADALEQTQNHSLNTFKQNNELKVKTFTFEFARFYNDYNYNSHLEKIRTFLTDEETDLSEKKEILTKAKSNSLDDKEAKSARELILSAKIAFNFFEGLALFYNLDLVDKEICKRLFKTSSKANWDIAKWYIDKVRSKYGNTIYEEWEKMNADFSK